MTQEFKILVIDPDDMYLKSLQQLLGDGDFRIYHAEDYDGGIQLANLELPNLVITELELGGSDGIDLCMELRENSLLDSTLLVMLTDRSENYAQIAALNAGADDYLIKPISARLLLSKVKSLLRRVTYYRQPTNQRVGNLQVDRDRFMIIRNGEEIALPRKEFEILSLLVSKPKKVFSRDEIKNEVWELPQGVRSRTIDVHIRKLREKVGDHLIKTVKGVGYKLES